VPRLETFGAFFWETRFINENHRASPGLLANSAILPLTHLEDSSLLVNLLILFIGMGKTGKTYNFHIWGI
jgi:hypothetical protein